MHKACVKAVDALVKSRGENTALSALCTAMLKYLTSQAFLMLGLYTKVQQDSLTYKQPVLGYFNPFRDSLYPQSPALTNTINL